MNKAYQNYQTVTISGALTHAGNYQFTTDLILPFQPDEIILKNLSVYDNDNVSTFNYRVKMFHLKTDLINNQVLASYPVPTQAYHESYYLPFKCTTPIHGTYTFNVVNGLTNALPAQGIDGDRFNQTLSITLLFVKHINV
eukprot:Lithocolla_globosa_v1_NODE_310_length_4558_cov_56.456362.p4 type:complete len:140 gc:universal NODE_310_length_4558_cov_56.456362:1773-1354(-)